MRPKKIGSARGTKLLFSFDPMEFSRVILADAEADDSECPARNLPNQEKPGSC